MPVDIGNVCEKCGNRGKLDGCRFCRPCLFAHTGLKTLEESAVVLDALKNQHAAQQAAIEAVKMARDAYTGTPTGFPQFLAWLSGLCNSLEQRVTGQAPKVYLLFRDVGNSDGSDDLIDVFATLEQAVLARDAQTAGKYFVTEHDITGFQEAVEAAGIKVQP